MSTPNHSPLPFDRGTALDPTKPSLLFSEDEIIGNIYKDEDAEFIVRACNNHYKLLEALKAISKELALPANQLMHSARRGDASNGQTLFHCIDLAEKAIAEAEQS